MTGTLCAQAGMSAGSAGLYTFTSFTFTSAGVTGRTGPTLSNCLSSYNTTTYPWLNNTSFFNVVGGFQYWTVPKTGSYVIEASGAMGGGTNAGLGARMTGTFQLIEGVVVKILVDLV